MSGAEAIWADPGTDVTIRLARSLAPEVLALLSRTVWGSRQIRYRILNLPEKLARLRDPYVFTLEADGALVAACVLDRCTKSLIDRPFDAFHFVMIATEDAVRGQGHAGLLVEQIRRYCETELARPGMAFAYIEASTVYSLSISESVGHTVEAEMPITVFSRLRPRADRRVAPLREEDRYEVVARLSRLYEGADCADFAESVAAGGYHVLRGPGGILAGVQAELLRWTVVELPGLAGWLVLNVLPKTPGLNRLLDPTDLRFLRFNNILAEPGREREVSALLSAVLRAHGAPLGLFLMDGRSEVLARLRSGVRFGLLSNALSGTAKLHMDFVGLSDAEIAEVAAREKLFGAADVF